MTTARQDSILVRLLLSAALALLATLVSAQSAHAVTGEYNFVPGAGGNSIPPPLSTGETPGSAPITSTGTTTTASGEVVEGGKKKKGGKKGKKKKEQKLPELGPARPPTIAAPVSAVARGTTPGLVPLAAVLAGILVVSLAGRTLIRKRAA